MAVGCDMCGGLGGCFELECSCACHALADAKAEVQALREAPCSSCTEHKSTIQALYAELEIAAADNDCTRREHDRALSALRRIADGPDTWAASVAHDLLEPRHVVLT